MKTTKENLAALLRAAAQTSENDDSIEGSIGWIAGDAGSFHVYGGYRFGNQLGQGSMRLLGDHDEAMREAWTECAKPKLVGPIERIDRTFEGWDCLRAPCETCKAGERRHGVHCAEQHLVVRGELEDGRRVALALTVFTGVYPETVPLRDRTPFRPDYYPKASDLSLHVQMPTDSPGTHKCAWFGERGRCYVDWTTALSAEEIYGKERTVDEALWQRLEAKLVERIAGIGEPNR